MYPHGACPWNICAEAHYSHAKGARNAETEKTNKVFRRRLTREAELSAAAEAIVCGIQRGCDNEVAVQTNLQVMSEPKNRATKQFARVGTYCTFPKESILIIALSARPFVEAAVKAGFAVTAIDAFTDAQTAALAEQVIAVAYGATGLYAEALLAALDKLDLSDFAGFVYGSGFEAQPQLLNRVAERLPLIGNTPDTVAGVKNPAIFFAALQQLQIPYPVVTYTLPENPAGRYLLKTAGGSGGMHIAEASRNLPLGDHQYFQQRINGTPVSVLFLSDRENITVVGFNEQWLSPTAEFPYRYGGAVGNVVLSFDVQAVLIDAASKLAQRFCLLGLNSLDAIIDAESGQVSVLEINPRLSATVDLYRGTERNLFDLHLKACQHQHDFEQVDLKPVDLKPVDFKQGQITSGHLQCFAHGIVYASDKCVLPFEFSWPEWVTDSPVPHQEGCVISPGEPVCSVLACADDAQSAKKLAQARVEMVQNLLQSLSLKNV